MAPRSAIAERNLNLDLTPEITVVIPVYRNADTLEQLAARLSTVLEKLGSHFELLFVNDACPQGSLSVLRELAREDDRISVLSLSRNTGQAGAVLAGLSYLRSPIFVIMDADLQDPPEAIPDLVRHLEEGYQVVFAGRAGRYESGRRLAASKIYKAIIHALTGLPLDAGLFLAARRLMAEGLLRENRAGIHIVPAIGTLGLKTLSVPVERAPRPSGKSAYTDWMRIQLGLRAAVWTLGWRAGLRQEQTWHAPPTFPIQEAIGAHFEQKGKAKDEEQN